MTAATIATGIRFNRNIRVSFDPSEGSSEGAMPVCMSDSFGSCKRLRSSRTPIHHCAQQFSTSKEADDHCNTGSGIFVHQNRTHVLDSSSRKEYGRLRIRKTIHRRKQLITDLSLFFAMTGLVLMILETELTMCHVCAKEDKQSLLLKCFITLTTICLLVLIVYYHASEVELFMVNNGIEDKWVAIGSDRALRFLAEFFVCAMHPLPFSHRFASKSSLIPGSNKNKTYVITSDLFMSLPMFMRLYLISRLMLLHSRMFTDISSRSIGAMNRINFNSRFVLKALMTICPGTVIISFVITLFMIASWTVRVCEIFSEPDKHSSILNSMWLVAVTFLAVGYGDIVPQTYCGRAVCVVSAMMGVSCTATMVAILTRKLELTRAEKHVHNFMMDSQLNKRLRESAAVVLQETWRIYKLTKLCKTTDGSKVRRHQRKFLRAVYRLRKLKIEHNELNENVNSVTDFSRTVASINESISQLKSQQKSLQHEIESMSSSVVELQDQVKRMPQLILCAIRQAQVPPPTEVRSNHVPRDMSGWTM